jgi:hypothetical protein
MGEVGGVSDFLLFTRYSTVTTAITVTTTKTNNRISLTTLIH